MRKAQIETMETEVNAELEARAEAEKSITDPIYDGVVDIDHYLASKPKMLWILKEPVDEVENGVPSGGGWSMTKHVLSVGKFDNKPPFAPIAYVTYSVFNNFLKYREMDYATEDPKIVASVKNIAYINVSKMPASSSSDMKVIGHWYEKNRQLLLKQIEVIAPDIIIGGYTLPLFFNDLGLKRENFNPEKTASFCRQDGRLYIDAYHPSQWSMVDKDVYVNDIVAIIKEHSPVLPPPQS